MQRHQIGVNLINASLMEALMGSVSAEVSRQTILVYWPARVANGQASPIRLSGYGAKRPKAMADYMFRHDISLPW